MLKKLFVILILSFFNINLSFAETAVSTASVFSVKTPVKNTLTALTPEPPVLSLKTGGYCLEDAYSGRKLALQQADQKMPPASLTKLMTLYLSFEALQAGRIHMTDLVTVSERAWKTGGSRMFIKVGEKVSVSDLIRGIIVDSGNDACVAMAEYIGSTEENFVNLMNQQAILLGMKNTHYMDCTGLPDPAHYTTPNDLSLLTRAIMVNFPDYYRLFAEKTFTYNKITQSNRNRLLWVDPSVDGLKTGHTEEAGFCLVASAKRDQMRLISVLLGAPSDKARAAYSQALLNYGFRFYETRKLYSQHQFIQKTPVYFGKANQVSVGVLNDFYVTFPSNQFSDVKIDLKLLSGFVKSPVQKDQKLGVITILFKNQPIASTDMVALENVPEANILGRMWDKIRLLLKH